MDIHKVEHEFRATGDGVCAQAQGGMVAAAFPQASKAGALMMQKGGNAADAAAAAALCLCVCEPQACGVGGQSMALLHMGGRGVFLDGVGRIPAAARLDKFQPGDQKIGYKATSVPTTVAVLGYLVREYGRLKWPDIVEPALAAASDGYEISHLQHRLQKRELPIFAQVASGSGARYFLKGPDQPYEQGEVFKQPELAGLLARLSGQGPQGFYTGKTAAMIDQDMRANGGFLSAGDLADIPWPLERPAIYSSYRGVELVAGPPPSAGRNLFSLLKKLETKPGAYWSEGGPQAMWDLARAIGAMLRDKRANAIDPAEYDPAKDPLLTPDGGPPRPGGPVPGPGDYGGETTHVSAIDRFGNAVGITQSVNLVYASKAAARGLGFLYNDYLLDCNTADPGHPNYLRPGGRPASSVVPLIALHDGAPWLVTGSPGTERILSTVAQFLIHVIDGGLPICQAMQKPRLHYSPEGVLSIEAGRFSQEVVEYLREQAGELSVRRDYSFYLGAIHAALRCRSRDGFQGVSEMRRDGIAAGC